MGTKALAVSTPTPASGPDWYDRIEAGPHPSWCGRGHRCGLGEHRAYPVTVKRPGTGGLVLTRVAHGDREHAEVRMRIELAPGDFNARAHLLLILAELETLLEHVDVGLRRR
jgi:hypothetical protein